VGGAHAESRSGPVVTKVLQLGSSSIDARGDGCSESAPLTYATYKSHVKNYIELDSVRCDLIGFASPMSRRGSIA
jgi:hypothetical protein